MQVETQNNKLMVRGKTWFKCPCCGKVFKAYDIEWNATVMSMPMPCPDCGKESPAVGPVGYLLNLLQEKRRSKNSHTL